MLRSIWSHNYISGLPMFVADRGFVFSENQSKKDILITGFNPSFRDGAEKKSHGYSFQNELKETKWDNYWGPLKKIIFDQNNNIDFRETTAYIDIFYFRERHQHVFKKEILNTHEGIQFAVEQLNLTQHIIEDIITPKIIIVKNKESSVYWGRLERDGFIWMGYKMEHIQNYQYGELYKITGLIDSNKRIAPEIIDTNLKGSLVLFSQHLNQFTSREKRPTASFVKVLLDNYVPM